jgi:hypothetical protein
LVAFLHKIPITTIQQTVTTKLLTWTIKHPVTATKKRNVPMTWQRDCAHKEISNYNLVAYKFTFGNSTLPASKLFKAIENDPTVYKVSLKEWDSFLLLTTKEFDAQSFESAASKVFGSFIKIEPKDFLVTKNISSYNEYILQQEKVSKINEQSK